METVAARGQQAGHLFTSWRHFTKLSLSTAGGDTVSLGTVQCSSQSGRIPGRCRPVWTGDPAVPGGGALVSSGASVPCRAIGPNPWSFHGHSLGTAQVHWTPEVQKITGICWRHSVWGGEAARRRPTNSRLPIAVCPMEMEHRVQTSHSTFPRSRVWKIIPGYTA